MALLTLVGCIPYTVGQTAATVAPGTATYAQSTFLVPRGFEFRSDSGRQYVPRAGIDAEFRYGLDDAVDVGVRVPSLTGLIVNLKRRQADERSTVWRAYTVGGGVVNAGQHLYGEFVLHVSASEYVDRPVTPFGALRVSQVIPLTREAVSDSPTIGLAVGAKIGDTGFAFLPEIGVFYDRSALGINSRSIIVVPSLSIMRARAR